MKKTVLFYALLLLLSCTKDQESRSKIFHKLEASKTGISFSNTLKENDSLNYLAYAYMYMGGGVSAGDINNDGLTDLYFTGNMTPNRLYLNKGNLTFEDISEKAGVLGDERWFTGVTMADINADGFLDIYCSVGGKFAPKNNLLYLNNGDETFTESAAAYGIDDLGNSVQATFFDYDRDGDLDLYVANYPPTQFNAPNNFYQYKINNARDVETDKLYRNDGERFTNVTDQAGLRSFGLSLSATVGDLNADGWPDLYVSNDFSTPDYLFMNNQDGTFTEQVKKATKQTSFYGMGVDIADFNNDRLLDILQVDMTAENNRRSKANMASMNPALFWSTVNAGFHYQYMQNMLQVNNGQPDGSTPDFSNVSRLAGVSATDWSWGPLFADLDNDGWKDIFISNGTRREINNKDYFNKLKKEKFTQESFLEKTLAIPSEKIDNFVFRNLGDLRFEKSNEQWGLQFKGFSNGAVYVDLDNDGDLEVVTNNIDDPAAVFENTSADRHNYLTLRFKGPEKNPFGLGVRATLFKNGQSQLQEMTLTRGFQSSVAPELHFGLGTSTTIDSLEIQWPDQKTQRLTNVDHNQLLSIDYAQAVASTEADRTAKQTRLFSSVAKETMGLQHQHRENYFDDFEAEVLLPHKTSAFGPGISVGDLNGDGLDDLVVGGASQYEAGLYFQTRGGFKKQAVKAIEKDNQFEDLGSLIFDAEGDGDNDIYLVSGGNEFAYNSEMLQDRLYLNDGRGNFKKSDALPTMITSGSRVYSHDYDQDGDLDLFVAGRLVPGNYPLPAHSYLLENVSTDKGVLFRDVTETIAPDLKGLGMVTSACWTDYDQDGWTDLMIVGEWMPISLFKNKQGTFKNVTTAMNLDDTTGWWWSIEQGDFDKDGDPDYLLGNNGLNYKYQANDTETFDIYANDFDKNNTTDIVLGYYNEGVQYPVRGRQCSSQQIPAIKNKFKDYESFSKASLVDVYTTQSLKSSLHYQVKSFASIYLENTEKGLAIHPLPLEAQLSSINQILVDDFDKDGNLDAVIAGNLHASEVETPRNDASNGLFLQGDGKGHFKAISGRESGLYILGDTKDLQLITIEDTRYIIAAKNNDYLQSVRLNSLQQ
jgi:hypothetical protein